MSKFSSAVKKLNIDANVAQILENQYNLNYSLSYCMITTDVDRYLKSYINTKMVLKEFGYNNEQLIAKKILYLAKKNLREKCLILENFRILNFIINDNVSTFKYSPEMIYAKICYYNDLKKQSIEKIDNKALTPLFHESGINFEKKYGVSEGEILKKYPLTKQKLQLMERIHNAKRNAQNKSGGVSL